MEYQVLEGGPAMTREPGLRRLASGLRQLREGPRAWDWGTRGGGDILDFGGGDRHQEVGPGVPDLGILRLKCTALESGKGRRVIGPRDPVAQLRFWSSSVSGLRTSSWGGGGERDSGVQTWEIQSIGLGWRL